MRQQTQRRARRVAGTLAAAFALSGLVGCTGIGERPKVDAKTAAAARKAPSEQLQRYYDQVAQWGKCWNTQAEGMQCAHIKVPMDYQQPDGKEITIEIARMNNTGKKSDKVLLLNPGGPGGSGVKFLPAATERMISASVSKDYMIASFDPRGVGESTPIRCKTAKELDEFRADADSGKGEASTPEADIAAAKKQLAEYGKQCQEKNGELLNHVSTVEAAKDMDVIRAVFENEKLYYLGYSYGTYLGAQYATLFPKKVGRMVLDGVLPSSYSISQIAELQAAGFDAALKHFFDYCINDGDCPLGNTQAAAQQKFIEFMNSLQEKPLPTGDSQRPLTRALAYEGVFGALYAEPNYQQLKDALTQAIVDRDGSSLEALADTYSDRNSDGSYSGNQQDAFMAINGLDYGKDGDRAAWEAQAKQLKEKYPMVADVFSYAAIQQEVWPAHPNNGVDQRRPLDAKGAPPILMIANSGDPATPLAGAKAAQQLMPSARLIEWKSYTHTAYGWGSKCIKDAVDNYLIDDVLPQNGLICKD